MSNRKIHYQNLAPRAEDFDSPATVKNEGDRLMIYFPHDLTHAMRAQLHQSGFIFSKSTRAWQRTLTPAAKESLNRLLPKIQQLHIARSVGKKVNN